MFAEIAYTQDLKRTSDSIQRRSNSEPYLARRLKPWRIWSKLSDSSKPCSIHALFANSITKSLRATNIYKLIREIHSCCRIRRCATCSYKGGSATSSLRASNASILTKYWLRFPLISINHVSSTKQTPAWLSRIPRRISSFVLIISFFVSIFSASMRSII